MPRVIRNPMSSLDEALMRFRFLRRLPSHLRNPLSLPECRQILSSRLAQREQDFLYLIQRAIWENRNSPYRLLLRHAGCERGDLESLVFHDGIEGALQALFRAGVYLTVDEYKGRMPVVRGNTTILVDANRLLNPLMAPTFWGATSGSRGQMTHIPTDLSCIRDRAVNMYLSIAGWGGEHWRTAVWGMPGIGPMLWFSVCGGPAARWFSTVDPSTSGLHPRYRWSMRAVAWTARLARVPMPFPVFAPLDAPVPITRWMEQVLNAGEVPHLWASSSSAVTVCRSARKAGIDLTGARLTITGEPVTEARLIEIRSSGASAPPDFGSADSGGSVGYGCLAPEAPDDIHIFRDLNGLIQVDAPPFPSGALLLSSIRPTVPFIFLNVSMGDRATIAERRCGCPLEKLGWHTHIHTIRSFEKLTAAGMTFDDADVVRILEEVLPWRFGGGPTDYQLVEEMAGDGRPQIRLLVHPAIGDLNLSEVAEFFLEALATGSGTRYVMALHWRDADVVRIERKAPIASTSGKILHLWTNPNLSRRSSK